MEATLEGFTTKWEQVTASDEGQIPDNTLAWEVMFVYGHDHPAMRTIRFAGMPDFHPTIVRQVLIDKQAAADSLVASSGGDPAVSIGDRCALCRLPFGSLYDDPTFGKGIRIERNRRNRYFCNICDAFIRICPGQATLTLPVLVIDVKHSRRIRAEVRDLRAYSQMLANFQRRAAAVIQQHMGFVLNTIGDAVVGVWPSGFLPANVREEMAWDPANPARIPAQQAIRAAEAIATLGDAEFDGTRLPMRGALDTTEMIIFSVTTGDDDLSEAFAARPEDRDLVGDPVIGAEASDIGTGPAATDIAGDAVETATELASDNSVAGGTVCITRRTDALAGIPVREAEYRAVGAIEEPVRLA